jgi:hypothetical protein
MPTNQLLILFMDKILLSISIRKTKSCKNSQKNPEKSGRGLWNGYIATIFKLSYLM